MSAEIVPIGQRARDELIWVCECGCTTHYHHDTGAVECGACGNHASISDDGWRARLPKPMPGENRELGPDNFKISFLNGAEAWLRRTAKDDADTICAMLVVYSDGSCSTWRDDDKAPEGRDWLIARLREAIARLE